MNEEMEIEKLREQLRIEQECIQILAGKESEIPFSYNLPEDVLKIPENTADRLGLEARIQGFLGGDYMNSCVLEEDISRFNKHLKKALEGLGKGEFNARLKVGKYAESDGIWYHITYSSVANHEGEIIAVVGKAENIQERREAAAKMEEQLQRDPITGLKNPFATQFSVEENLEKTRRKNGTPMKGTVQGALLVIKIEGMKQIFETYGRVFGSAVLQNLGAAIKSAFRSSDVVGRTGTEEFLIYMQGVNESVASRKAEDICRKAASLYTGEGSLHGIFANAGIAYYPMDADNYKELYRYAQTAVKYAAKEGKNSIMAYESRMKLVPDILQLQTFEQEKEMELIGKYDMDFLTFAFSLLSHSKDMNSAINLLLDRIGSHYDLSNVCIYEKDRESQCLLPTNFWERGNGIQSAAEVISYEDEQEIGTFDERGFLCMEDCDQEEYDMLNKGRLYDRMFRKHVKSMIAYSFEDAILGEGNIYFGDCKRKRHWSKMEKSTLYECARMLSVFVFLRKEHFRDKERINELLQKDQLTGLYNRKTFEEEVKKYLEEGWTEELALIFSDINDFEYVNSNFGTDAGNKILCDYAGSLEKTEGMVCACRIYSDYFLALYRGKTKKEIEENIKSNDDEFVHQQKQFYPASNLRLSTGICYIEQGQEDISGIIENANLARKRAKAQQNNQVEVYQSQFREEKEHEQNVAGSIHEAIEKEQIELFLQPKFSLTTRRIIGAEALVRWRNDDGSLRSPGEFIPVLEKVGYIVELDFYIYEQVLIYMRKWRQEGKTLVPVSVNFSRRHIQHDDFVKRVTSLAERYEVDPGMIEIEITENSISENNQKMLDDMDKLRKNGFKVDIDDFGTGYSSLNMLLNAPVDTVKIDKSFLKNIDNSEKERRYIDNLAHLINAAEKEIIFEGVETEHQAKILTECGYTMAQGYLFDRPIPADEFDRTYMVSES